MFTEPIKRLLEGEPAENERIIRRNFKIYGSEVSFKATESPLLF